MKWGINYRFHWWLVRFLYHVWGGADIRGVEKVPVDGPLIIAANHASYMDPSAIGGAMPRPISYMARKTLFENWALGTWIGSLNAFPIDRDGDSREALRTFCDRLDRGDAVLMFPEGTRTCTGKLAPLEKGVCSIATRAGAPILPVYLWGSYHSWPRGQSGPRLHRLKIYFGEPIAVQGGLKGQERKTEQERVYGELDSALHELEDRCWEGEEPPIPLQIEQKENAASETGGE